MNDWVATAPTPASAHETPDPTENAWDWTATPISPVVASRATIEYVWTGRRGTAASGPAATIEGSRSRRRSEAAARRLMKNSFGRDDNRGSAGVEQRVHTGLHLAFQRLRRFLDG